jgi:hypothetical protein
MLCSIGSTSSQIVYGLFEKLLEKLIEYEKSNSTKLDNSLISKTIDMKEFIDYDPNDSLEISNLQEFDDFIIKKDDFNNFLSKLLKNNNPKNIFLSQSWYWGLNLGGKSFQKTNTNNRSKNCRDYDILVKETYDTYNILEFIKWVSKYLKKERYKCFRDPRKISNSSNDYRLNYLNNFLQIFVYEYYEKNKLQIKIENIIKLLCE